MGHATNGGGGSARMNVRAFLSHVLAEQLGMGFSAFSFGAAHGQNNHLHAFALGRFGCAAAG
jgi:hypothetical protein